MLVTEGDRLAAVDPDRLDAPVPTLEGWTVERVVRHVGRVHRWATRLLEADAEADPDAMAQAAPSLPRGPECLPAYRSARDDLLAVCDRVDPERPVASFLGPARAAFWIRRQAHELTVHRLDAQDAVHAAGGPPPDPMDPVAAGDGVAEWLEVFAASVGSPQGEEQEPLWGRRIAVAARGEDGSVLSRRLLAWTAAPGAPGPSVETPDPTTDPEHPDVTLDGPAGALLAVVWRRRPLDTVTVEGDPAVARALLDAVRV